MDLPEDVVIRRSARRRRTLQARREGGRIVVMIPASLSDRELHRLVPPLVAKVRAREAGGRRGSDAGLAEAARRLAHAYAPDLGLLERLRSVTWSGRQQQRWGSCTTATGDIRLSDRLRSMPDWVVDYVLFHELLHLEEAGHGPRFQALMRRYPKHDLAKGFLHGVAYGTGADPDAWDEQEDASSDPSL